MHEKFKIAAEAVGAVIKHFSSLDDIESYLHNIAEGGIVRKTQLTEKFESALSGLTFSDQRPAADTTLCLSMAEAGIAATGSLLIYLPDPDQRALTALATKHAVFLRRSCIVPTIRDLSPTLKEQLSGSSPNYLSITTGPSRTADIERVLTIGVHGPKELHILILEGE